MNIEFECPQCGKSVKCDETFRGQVAACPHCGKGIVVPRNTTPAQEHTEKKKASLFVRHSQSRLSSRLNNPTGSGGIPQVSSLTTMRLECPHCRKTVEADSSFYGQTAECPYCGKTIVMKKNPSPDHTATRIPIRFMQQTPPTFPQSSNTSSKKAWFSVWLRYIFFTQLIGLVLWCIMDAIRIVAIYHSDKWTSSEFLIGATYEKLSVSVVWMWLISMVLGVIVSYWAFRKIAVSRLSSNDGVANGTGFLAWLAFGAAAEFVVAIVGFIYGFVGAKLELPSHFGYALYFKWGLIVTWIIGMIANCIAFRFIAVRIIEKDVARNISVLLARMSPFFANHKNIARMTFAMGGFFIIGTFLWLLVGGGEIYANNDFSYKTTSVSSLFCPLEVLSYLEEPKQGKASFWEPKWKNGTIGMKVVRSVSGKGVYVASGKGYGLFVLTDKIYLHNELVPGGCYICCGLANLEKDGETTAIPVVRRMSDFVAGLRKGLIERSDFGPISFVKKTIEERKERERMRREAVARALAAERKAEQEAAERAEKKRLAKLRRLEEFNDVVGKIRELKSSINKILAGKTYENFTAVEILKISALADVKQEDITKKVILKEVDITSPDDDIAQVEQWLENERSRLVARLRELEGYWRQHVRQIEAQNALHEQAVAKVQAEKERLRIEREKELAIAKERARILAEREKEERQRIEEEHARRVAEQWRIRAAADAAEREREQQFQREQEENFRRAKKRMNGKGTRGTSLPTGSLGGFSKSL